jgi:hypothetical protein
MADRQYIGPAYKQGIIMPDRRLGDPASWTQEQIHRLTAQWPEIDHLFSTPTATISKKDKEAPKE